MRSARRRSVMRSGVGKTPSSTRRGTLGGVINGTPHTTLAELLKEAEATIILEEGSLYGLTPAKPSSSSKTLDHDISSNPQLQAARSTFKSPTVTDVGPRGWSKSDWKVLDTCYTDERLALGGGSLAPADTVDLGKIVDRFTAKMGGTVMATMGLSWSR